ncbi:MAG: HEAT repeat domain-containing protein [Planctomycetes bacterium]|nr:HEAT repeat domain-containing protein [Planctomycetota bacterium]
MAWKSLSLVVLLSIALANPVGAQPDDEAQAEKGPMPPLANAPPFEAKQRLAGAYSARSTLKDDNPLDGIGVVDNWSKLLDAKGWGAKGAVSLIAFPNEAVAYGNSRGFMLRLVNRTDKPAEFLGCDARLAIVQEARDDMGRWREIENLPYTTCGNSYHQVFLEANRYWEFAARASTGPSKTKIRFRLDVGDRRGKDQSIYSNEFDGQVAKVQFRMEPRANEIRKALRSKDAREDGVMETLIALVGAKEDKDDRQGAINYQDRAVEHLAELGPSAKEALPALRKLLNESKSELRANTAFTIWRIDGDTAACVKTVLAVLDGPNEDNSRFRVAAVFWHMGPAAKDAVPTLVRLLEKSDEYTQHVAIGAVGAIRSHPDLVLPVLTKALASEDISTRRRAAEALGEYGPVAKDAIAQLVALFNDKDGYACIQAAFAVWKIEGKTDRAVPALVALLKATSDRTLPDHAAAALGTIGPAAKDAIPALTAELKSDRVALRVSAAGALWKITQKPEPTLSVLIAALETKQFDIEVSPDHIIGILEDMGPQARSAIPALRALHRRSEWHRDAIEKALKRIGA